jgi:hypothetical protein
MSKKRLALTILIVGVAAGLVVGALVGVLTSEAGRRTFHSRLSAERPADVAHPQTIDREGFSLQYPGNWRRHDEPADNRDPDRLFSLDSPGSSFAMFAVYDAPTDPATNVAIQLRDFVPAQIKDPARADLTRWGAYTGSGVILKGPTLQSGAPATLRLFSHTDTDRSFVVVEMIFDEDLADVDPGLKLVESTFKLKP